MSGRNKDEPKALKDVLEENKKRAEDQWNEEHKFKGPKPLDHDEFEFLQGKEDERRLKFLERELEDMKAVEEFHNEMKNKVYEVPKEVPTTTAAQQATSGIKILPKTKTNGDKVNQKKPTIVPKIVPLQKKRKVDDCTDETSTKENSSSTSKQAKSNSTEKSTKSNGSKEKSSPKTTDAKNNNQSALAGLLAYSDGDSD